MCRSQAQATYTFRLVESNLHSGSIRPIRYVERFHNPSTITVQW